MLTCYAVERPRGPLIGFRATTSTIRHVATRSFEFRQRNTLLVGSKHSTELEVALSTTVTDARISVPQPLELTHLALEAGRFSCPRPSFQCKSCSSPTVLMLKAELKRTTGKPLDLTPEDRQRLAEKAAGIEPAGPFS